MITVYRILKGSTFVEFGTLASAQVYASKNNINFDQITEHQIEVYETSSSKVMPSLAVDKGEDDGTDQLIEGEGWVEITAHRKLWDANEDYDLENNNFDISRDGVYFFDGQFRIVDMVNCSSVEVAIFKREDPEDDYWFIIDEAPNSSGKEKVHLSGATGFDFRSGESYCLKIKLTKTNVLLACSAKILGSDDYTAWGFNWIRELY